MKMHVLIGVMLGVLATGPVWAAEFFVAPDGLASGDGSAAKPWDLATALDGAKQVQPGDTIRLKAGTCRGGFVCTLKGAQGKPITIRPESGARVTIDCKPRDERDDGQFYVRGDWLIVRDLEFTCSNPKRVTGTAGSGPADMRRGGISSHGSHNAMVNLVIHDTNGAGFWGDDKTGEGGEFHGCIIYNNGWKGPDRGHGHALYAQNGLGTKRITDNVMFNPNRYEKGRAHIIAYNWDKRDVVEVDLGSLLPAGQRFRIVSAQDFFGEPVLQGVADGKAVRLAMKPRAAARPVGMPDYKLPITEPEFGVFVVLPEPAK